jgi:hypothetical protein
VKPFITEGNVTEIEDVKAKAEYLGLQEDNTLTEDFQDSGPATFWRKAGFKILFLCDRTVEILITFANTYRCEAGFS